MIRRVMIGLVLVAALFGGIRSAEAQYPLDGWVYVGVYPYVYEANYDGWTWINDGSAVWCCDMTTGTWGMMGSDRLNSGWCYLRYPYAYSVDTAHWYYMNETDKFWFCRLATGTWNREGYDDWLLYVATMTIDGSPGDWNSFAPFFLIGDASSETPTASCDIKGITLAEDATNLYVRFEVDGTADIVANQYLVVLAPERVSAGAYSIYVENSAVHLVDTPGIFDLQGSVAANGSMIEVSIPRAGWPLPNPMYVYAVSYEGSATYAADATYTQRLYLHP